MIAPISKIRVVTDENPFPPGLYRKSILCLSQARQIKFTAPTKSAHEIWLQVHPQPDELTVGTKSSS